jgi:pyruvate dehydrogenase E2 component (dihydrolipoamide acetyltransferase)
MLAFAQRAVNHRHGAGRRLALRELRERERALAEGKGVRLTYLPFIVKALTLVLERFPLLNSSLDEEKEEIVLHRRQHIGFAVDTPEGLLVPVVRDARRKSILELAAALQSLNGLGSGRSAPNGGISQHGHRRPQTLIINPPQSAILGAGGSKAPVGQGGRRTAVSFIPDCYRI